MKKSICLSPQAWLPGLTIRLSINSQHCLICLLKMMGGKFQPQGRGGPHTVYRIKDPGVSVAGLEKRPASSTGLLDLKLRGRYDDVRHDDNVYLAVRTMPQNRRTQWIFKMSHPMFCRSVSSLSQLLPRLLHILFLLRPIRRSVA